MIPLIDKLNKQFVAADKNYILCGPGRWGSKDQFLGVPVQWGQISAARVIIESGLENFFIEPSQGSHFFQNLTSFRVAYFTIYPFKNDGFYDLDYLNGFEAVYEDEYFRHIRFEKPVLVKIDGRESKAAIFKPEE